jgi:hypothetical protein
MARVPVITSPCPLRIQSAPRPGKDFCGHCERRVHNLDLLSAAKREEFLAGCSGKVCVSYSVRRVNRTPRAIGIGLAAIAFAGAVGASDQPVQMPDSPYCDLDLVTVGGTEAGEKLQWVDDSEVALPDKDALPTIDAADWLPTPDK